MNKKATIGSIQLFLTAVIWGVAFVAQSDGMNYVGPFTFNCVRSFLGSIVLLPCIWWMRTRNREENARQKEGGTGTLIAGGLCCGLFLFLGSSAQQIALQYTTVGKAGFLTALYIVLVPAVSMVFGKKTDKKIWFCVCVALVGLYFLCVRDGWSIGTGDGYLLLGALFFTGHILVIDHFAPKTDNVKMSCIQFFVTGMCCLGPALVREQPSLPAIADAKIPILYAGIFSCGVAYTLQIMGQKTVKPTVASLILSGESIVSVLAGWILLHQVLSLRELFGCVLLFAAIVLAQVDVPAKAGTE